MVQTPGQKLKQIRESRGISVEEISLKTHMRIEYIEAIESGDTELLSSPTQQRGFLRLYAGEMGIDLNDLMDQEDPSAKPITKNDTPDPTDQSPEALQETPIDEIQLPAPEETSTPSAEIQDEAEEFAEDKVEELSIFTGQEQPPHFTKIGEKIKERRELLSLSLDEIEKHIHIRIDYLKTIEAGRLDELPSPVQAKGMLSNYAEFLNLDTDMLMLDYADGLQEKRVMNQADGPYKKRQPAKMLSSTGLKLKNFFSLDLLIILIIFIAFTTFVVWGVNRILAEDQPSTVDSEIPEVSDILLATGSPTPQSTELENTDEVVSTELVEQDEAVPLFTQLANFNPINVLIIPLQQAWVQITADSEIIFVGRLLPGNAYDYSAEDSLEILTGNAGALQIYFNEADIGSPGIMGQVVELIFTQNGLVLPTPTNTPTTTPTPEITPSPSVTPSPSITPTSTTFP
jgi:cytoskeletal protein RodZ